MNVFLLAGQSNMAGADSEVAVPPGFQQTTADLRFPTEINRSSTSPGAKFAATNFDGDGLVDIVWCPENTDRLR